MKVLKCNKCGNNHVDWEHKIYEKLKLVEIGVPYERLFVCIPDELNINFKKGGNENGT